MVDIPSVPNILQLTIVAVDDIDDDIGDFITVLFDSGVKKRVSVFDLEEV